MTRLNIILLALVPATVFGAATPVQPDASRRLPPPGVAISSEDRKELEAGVAKLGQTIEGLRGALRDNPALLRLLPDVQIYHKAVDWALRYDEFFTPTNEVRAAKALLRQGLERAQQLRDGQPAWPSATGLVVRAYVSKIDGSIQPYGLVVPASFQPTRPPLLTSHPHRLDIWLHGRDEKLTELKFINDRQRSPGEFTPSNAIVLHPYGRYCNAFKFAGEIDVLEAMDHVTKSYPIDTNRIVLRGFSMGGAGCWHLAAHYPWLWAAAAPGAGFAETPEYMKALERNPPPLWYEQKLWHLYNATDYAANFFNLPVVAYSGEIDKQKQAADIMAKAMSAEGLELVHIIGPQTAHRYHPEAKQEINRRIDEIVSHGRDPLPRKIHFTTSTLRYNQSGWLRVERLEKHWEQARVEAECDGADNVSIKTTNVFSIDAVARHRIALQSGRAASPHHHRWPVDRNEARGEDAAGGESLLQI
jgi:pimeloyl-ACP methyl ester carboxylesterase